MEGEAYAADFSLRLLLFDEFKRPEGFGILPMRRIEPMEEIEVEISSLCALQLLVEDALVVSRRTHHCNWHLACEKITVARIFGEDAADEPFAVAVVVHVCSVEIVASRLKSLGDHLLRRGIVDFAVLLRQPH